MGCPVEIMMTSLVKKRPTGGEAPVFGQLTCTLKGVLFSPDSAMHFRQIEERLPPSCHSVSLLGKPLLVEDGRSFTWRMYITCLLKLTFLNSKVEASQSHNHIHSFNGTCCAPTTGQTLCLYLYERPYTIFTPFENLKQLEGTSVISGVWSQGGVFGGGDSNLPGRVWRTAVRRSSQAKMTTPWKVASSFPKISPCAFGGPV